MSPLRQAVEFNHIPEHLLEHIAVQNYDLYTAIDHASWRYIMRVSKDFFKEHAHPKYISGLEQTGITIDHIPRIEEMDEKLKKIGWRAVTVTGFIPPSVFLEFQSLSILPIACDMRRLEHVEYTPSPDIVHEAAGHAPIIADPDYASYLHKFGEIARKAIFAQEDFEVYHAIKHLSDIKEEPHTTEAEIEAAYTRLKEAGEKVKYASEATKLSRLGWWSIEYGLVKSGDMLKIYGAGLLSSVSESYNAIHGDVKKVPLTIECTSVDYDITQPQPQLFYVEDFKELESVIDELADTMAYKIGGVKALAVAQKARTVTTTVLNTRLQISGVLSRVRTAQSGEIIYLHFAGPTQLSFNDKELKGHSPMYHSHGFGTPLGQIKDINKTADKLTAEDLKNFGFSDGQKGQIQFVSGVQLVGELVSCIQKKSNAELQQIVNYDEGFSSDATNLVMTFTDCKVTLGNEVLFDPAWGTFDMACGVDVLSVYGGAADRAQYLKATGEFKASPKSQFSNLTVENRDLNDLYFAVRELRSGDTLQKIVAKIEIVYNELQKFKSDWLLRLELLELLSSFPESETDELRKKLHWELDDIANKSDVQKTLIQRGLRLLGQ